MEASMVGSKSKKRLRCLTNHHQALVISLPNFTPRIGNREALKSFVAPNTPAPP